MIMLGTLIQKQLLELYRGFFVNQKKGSLRSRLGVAVYFVLYAGLILGVVGGAFFALAKGLCEPLCAAGLTWLYFALFAALALVLGVFSGGFTVHTTVYGAKDNDLLLSLPVPVGYILTARLFSVYLMGLTFTLTVQLPALLVYAGAFGASASVVLCALGQMLCVSLLALVLSCALGWVVAKLSARFQNRSFIKVLASLVFFVLYYVVYFRFLNDLRHILDSAAAWGGTLRGVYPVYGLGAAAAGDGVALGLLAALTAALLALTLRGMARGFLGLAAGGRAASGRERRPGRERVLGASAALRRKEFARFTSNANYMLNCGLGTLLLPALGIFALLKGPLLRRLAAELLGAEGPAVAGVLAAGAITMVMAMNDTCAAAVSLEGRSIWILQSLPVEPWQVLRAKLSVQLWLTLPGAVLCAGLCALALGLAPLLTLLLMALCGVNSVLLALGDLALNLKMPHLTWTNELYPIKQSGSVAIAVFAPWLYAAAVPLGFLFAARPLGAGVYLGLLLAVSAAAAGALGRWLRIRGSRLFSAL